MGLVERLVALAVNWLDRRSPSARWESREDHEARALLPFGGLDLELRHDAGSLRVSSALEDWRRRVEDTLQGLKRIQSRC